MSDYPDFNISALLKGMYAEEVKPIALDKNGQLIAVLKALYGTIPKGLQCDANGNITINLNAQELNEVITRNKYGVPNRKTDQIYPVKDTETDVLIINGKGIVYASYIFTYSTNYTINDYFSIYLDNANIGSYSWYFMTYHNLYNMPHLPICCVQFDEIKPALTAQIAVKYTFEEQFKVTYYAYDSGLVIDYNVIYALV